MTICGILEAALILDRETAARLPGARDPRTGQAYSDAWLRQLGDARADDEEGLERVLHMGFERPHPAVHGLTLAHTTVFKRARAVDPERSTDHDEEDSWLLDPWDGADAALGEAVMAAGARAVISDEAYAILTQAWRTVSGPMPDPT